MPINHVRFILSHLATINEGMPVSYARAFIEIVQDPGLSITTLAERLGSPLSTVSRSVAALADDKKYGLITVTIAEDEKRRKVLNLSAAGEKLAALF